MLSNNADFRAETALEPSVGTDLTNLEYSVMAEVMGRSRVASEACNCSAP